MSFSNVSLGGEDGFSMEAVGVDNYTRAFTVDPDFNRLLVDSIKDVLINAPSIIIFSLIAAVLLNRRFPGRGFVRAIFFMPVVLTSGVVLGLAGIFGLFTVLKDLVPPAVVAITFLWCAVIMVAQAFKECKPKHYAAIAIAMVPSIADFLFTQVEAALATGSMAEGGWGIWSEALESANGRIKGFSAEISESLAANGAMWNGVPEVKAGAIIIGILLGSMCVFMIDRKLKSAALIALAGAVLSLFGFIHHAALGIYLTSPFMIGWLIVAVILFALSFGEGKWFKADDDFDYV